MKRLLVATFSLTLLAGCASKASVPISKNQVNTTVSASDIIQELGGYPPEAVNTFMQGCTAGQPSSMEKNCACMIQQIQGRYTYAQYQTLVRANLTSDPGIQKIINSCADAPSTTTVQANNTSSFIQGQDGAFLGVVSNEQVAEKSVCNQVGAYGSQVTPDSIRNQVGNYGSQISDFSAYNPNAQKPPFVIQNGQVIGVLTKNRNIKGGTDPDVFFQSLCG